MIHRHDKAAPAPIQLDSAVVPAPDADTQASLSSRHPLQRRHMLDAERQSENSVFSLERSPIELEIETGFGSFVSDRSHGWTTRSL